MNQSEETKTKQKETMKNTNDPKTDNVNDTEELTKREMECVTTVFKSFETGLREATISPKVVLLSHIRIFHFPAYLFFAIKYFMFSVSMYSLLIN